MPRHPYQLRVLYLDGENGGGTLSNENRILQGLDRVQEGLNNGEQIERLFSHAQFSFLKQRLDGLVATTKGGKSLSVDSQRVLDRLNRLLADHDGDPITNAKNSQKRTLA